MVALSDSHSSSDVSDSLGQRLKRARLSHGLSLDQLAESTRITAVQLQDIENGNYEKLPSEVYVRGFVRSFAHAVGVDSNQALAQYASERRAMGHGDASNNDEETQAKRRGLRLGLVIACSAVLIVLVYVILAFGKVPSGGTTQQEIKPLASQTSGSQT